MFGNIGSIYGMKIVIDDKLVIHKQTRFPKSKKKRIQKKWFKNSKNWHTCPDRIVYHMPGQQIMVMHPIVAEQLTNYTHQKQF